MAHVDKGAGHPVHDLLKRRALFVRSARHHSNLGAFHGGAGIAPTPSILNAFPINATTVGHGCFLRLHVAEDVVEHGGKQGVQAISRLNSIEHLVSAIDHMLDQGLGFLWRDRNP